MPPVRGEGHRLRVAGVSLDARGAPGIDAQLRTTNPRVVAAGDVTLGPQFVYVAAYEGGLAVENALTGAHRASDLSALPGVIFTEPQVATVGLTRQQAEAQGRSVRVVCLPLSIVHRAIVNHETDGVFVLIADAASEQVLGAQVVASNAGDVIYAATLAVKHGLTISDLVNSFAPYLTMAEGLRLSAVAFHRDVAKLSCCA
jgi:mercuric reductase